MLQKAYGVDASVILDSPSWSLVGKKISFNLTKRIRDIDVLENY